MEVPNDRSAAQQSAYEERAGLSSGDRTTGESLQGQGVEGVPGLRDEVPLDTRLRAYELDGGASLAQSIRHAQRGYRVPPRTAPGDQDPGSCGREV